MEEVVKEDQSIRPQKTDYVKLPKWLVAVFIIIVVIILGAGMLVAGMMLGKNQNVAVKTAPSATPTTTAAITVAPSAAPAKTIPQFPVSSNPNLIRFTSEKLGVSFTYL